MTTTYTFIPVRFTSAQAIAAVEAEPTLVLAGSVTVATGNALSADGHSFPATAVPSADPNTLDDYEEGTWTPAITFLTNGDLSVTYSSQVSRYTKIGNLVTIQFNIRSATFTHTTASGRLIITGLPFAVVTLTDYDVAGGLVWAGITNATYTAIVPRLASAQAVLHFYGCASGIAATLVDAADMPTTGSLDFRGGMAYQV